MVDIISDMIDETIGKEGKYSNHPDDTGGETMWGITKNVARRNGYLESMRDLPRAEAFRIYREEYLVKPGFADVADIYPKVGAELFDTGVNMGPKWPAVWLQMLLNAFNDQGKHYRDIAEDGDIGPGTLTALAAFKSKRGADGEKVLLAGLNAFQAVRYVELSRTRQRNESFVYGWFANRVVS